MCISCLWVDIEDDCFSEVVPTAATEQSVTAQLVHFGHKSILIRDKRFNIVVNEVMK
jgi:hypothetical protein